MLFELLPVLNTMANLYSKPANRERFDAYLAIIEGNTKGGMVVPVGSYNPMAKQDYIDKLNQLIAIDAEGIAQKCLGVLNDHLKKTSPADSQTVKVCINLADDLNGGWTNRYFSDYDSKFKIGPMIKRGFCVPVIWVSDDFGETIITRRIMEYVFRAVYRFSTDQPTTLEDHVLQEEYVKHQVSVLQKLKLVKPAYSTLFYNLHKDTSAIPVIMNYLYGDDAAVSLGYTPGGAAGYFV